MFLNKVNKTILDLSNCWMVFLEYYYYHYFTILLLCYYAAATAAAAAVSCFIHYLFLQILIDTASELGITHHPSATIITIEGPRFSSKAESNMFRLWGADIVNMTTVPEVRLIIYCAKSSIKLLNRYQLINVGRWSV